MILTATILAFLTVTLLVGAVGARVALAPRRAAIDRLRNVQTPSAKLAALEMERTRGSSWWKRLFPAKKKDSKRDLTALGLKPSTSTARVLLYAGYRSHTALRNLQLARMTCGLVLGSVPLIVGKYKVMAPEVTFMPQPG